MTHLLIAIALAFAGGLCAGLALALSRVEEIEDAFWRKDREWIERE